MSDCTNLRQINKRLNDLEACKVSSSSKQPFLAQLESSKKHEQEDLMAKLHEEAKEAFLFNKKNTGKLLDVIEFVVEFVENVIEYVPDIVQLVGGALKGDIKLGLALDLITDLFGEVTDKVAPAMLPDLVEKVVDLKFHPDKGITREEIETSNFHIHPKVNIGKKNYFLFSLRLKKKRENEINLRV